jgi:regulator of protease activity HflC (stomatin/prohibitin superfamily)
MIEWIILVGAFLLIVLNVVIVPFNRVHVYEHMMTGKLKVLTTGPHLVPFWFRSFSHKWSYDGGKTEKKKKVAIKMNRRIYDPGFLDVSTADGVTVSVNTVAEWQIVDVAKACTSNENLKEAVARLIDTAIRAKLAQTPFVNLQTIKEIDGKSLRSSKDNYGVEILAVRIEQVKIPENAASDVQEGIRARLKADTDLEVSRRTTATRKLMMEAEMELENMQHKASLVKAGHALELAKMNADAELMQERCLLKLWEESSITDKKELFSALRMAEAWAGTKDKDRIIVTQDGKLPLLSAHQ